MSISGYFVPRSVELRMPKTADSLNISFEGSVLTGRKSVKEAQRDEAIAACNTTLESYQQIEDYDPVLRSQIGMSAGLPRAESMGQGHPLPHVFYSRHGRPPSHRAPGEKAVPGWAQASTVTARPTW
jgi:hypothetical protein